MKKTKKVITTSLLTMFVFFSAGVMGNNQQDYEHYLQEANKIARDIYENTDDENVVEKILYIEKMYKESSVGALDILAQNLSDSYSFVGDYSRSLEMEDSRGIGVSPATINLNNSQVMDAVDVITTMARERQIVMVNEAHHIPQHRVLTYRLLKGLWDAGYRYLALETLVHEYHDYVHESYIEEKAGYYTREPLYSNLVLMAKKIGYELVAYDSNAGSINARETEAAEAILSQLDFSSNETKVLVHVGWGHINEISWLAGKLKQMSGIDPLTINQTEFRERSEEKFESSLYGEVVNFAEEEKFDAPFVIMSDNKLWVSSPEKYDINVFWPRTVQKMGRPEWVSLGRDSIPISDHWCAEDYPCLVQVLKNDLDDVVPSDAVLLRSKGEAKSIYFNDTSDRVVIKNASGTVIYKEVISNIDE